MNFIRWGQILSTLSETHTQQEVEKMTPYWVLVTLKCVIAPEHGRMKLTDEQKRIFGYS